MYSIVTPNRNRLETLREVLPSWQATPLVSEIVIVDFGSDRPIEPADFASRDKLKLVRVVTTEEWRISLAINLGIDHAASDAILKLDSDIEIRRPECLAELSLDGAFYRGRYTSSVSNGQAAFLKRDWQRIGGYNEWLSGYGFDDSDFYLRMRRQGLEERAIAPDALVERQHSLDSRTAPTITTEFFHLNPPDPKARMVFTASRNTYLAYMCGWSPQMRRRATARPLADNVIGVELASLDDAYRKAAAFANFLGLVRLTGSKEQQDLLAAMIAKFLTEDGGL